jgi:hypothetical protein
MPAAWELQLAIGLTAKTNEQIESGLWNFVWRYFIHIPRNSALTIVSRPTTKHIAIVRKPLLRATNQEGNTMNIILYLKLKVYLIQLNAFMEYVYNRYKHSESKGENNACT